MSLIAFTRAVSVNTTIQYGKTIIKLMIRHKKIIENVFENLNAMKYKASLQLHL
jgi:hypothetical protein